MSELNAVEQSRRDILHEIGDADDLTFVRNLGNLGDHLIWAGTRELLGGHIYREIGVDEVAGARGHTALIAGGGAFTRLYAWMPRLLAVAERRFERVILLPSSFDLTDDRVQRSLSRTHATVFAREADSYERISSLCDARLAHDCAFFFDFAPFRRNGHGVLNSFRTDPESLGAIQLPDDNDDISVTATGLRHWLETIAAHATVRTDRAHVMIAAALLGKRVEYVPNSYHKVQAIAEYSLAGFQVTRLRIPAGRHAPTPAYEAGRLRERMGELAPVPATQGRRPRHPRPCVTAIVLTRGRPELALAAVDSIARQAVPVRTILLDNNSAPTDAHALATGCATRDNLELRRSDRNLGCAGGRRLVLESVDTDLTLLLDDDAELLPGALDHLVADLDGHADACGVTATLVDRDGRVTCSGGWAVLTAETLDFTSLGVGLDFKDPRLPATGASDWLPGTAALVRTELFKQFPLDDQMCAGYEDIEWSHRVELARPGSFRRCREALALHIPQHKIHVVVDFTTRSVAMEFLLAQAHFYRRHGVLLGADLLALGPELERPDGTADLAAARLLMELTLANGTDWVFTEWMNGGLDPLFSAAGMQAELDDAQEELRRSESMRTFLSQRHETLVRIENGGWWRLRRRLLPLLRVAQRLRNTHSTE